MSRAARGEHHNLLFKFTYAYILTDTIIIAEKFVARLWTIDAFSVMCIKIFKPNHLHLIIYVVIT